MNIAHLPYRAVLAVTGTDRASFLQGLVSNDVSGMAPGQAVWAALLTPQGKYLADFFVIAEPDRLLLDVEAAWADDIATRLRRYKLRADVAVAPVALAVHAAWDTPPPQPGAAADPRLPEAGWRVLLPDALPNTDWAAWDLHRLHLGLPDGTRDLERERSVLLEGGFDELHGVSWSKGCYMGQELTARTKYRGLIKRRLFPVEIEGALPEPGTPVLLDGQEIGTMRSGRGTRGMALLRIEAAKHALRCADAVLRPVIPGWMQLPE